MHGIAKYHQEEKDRVQRVLEETRGYSSQKRLEVLTAEVEAAKKARSLMLSESLSLVFGGSGAGSFVTEDPLTDDGEVWNEVGYHRGGRARRGLFARRMTMRDLQHAREIGRLLADENEYVIGSMQNRVAYTVGEGLVWRLVPKDRMAEDRKLTHEGNDFLEAFREAQDMDLVEQEHVIRQDRDGNSFIRCFGNADGPGPNVRFMDPVEICAPAELPQDLPLRAQHALSMGVDVEPYDVRTVKGYYVWGELGGVAEYVPAWHGNEFEGLGIRHVHHAKINCDLMDPHGWPTYWPIRKNMSRSEKLLRNMSYVAALQAAIALIRKHSSGTEAEVEALLRQHSDLSVTNNLTGKTTEFREFGPGLMIDAMGFDYEAPVSSVNAGNNMQVLDADLRGSAAAVQQPAFMFTGKVDGGFASEMVAEGPHHKAVKRLQARNKKILKRVHWDAIVHDVRFGRLDPAILQRYKLEVDFPDPLVRDHLQQTQRYQILRDKGAISLHTWRAREGLNPEEEDRLLDQEARRGFVDPRKGEVAEAKPAPGSTEGGPGGADQRGGPAASAPGRTF